jgi:hypothetical protein
LIFEIALCFFFKTWLRLAMKDMYSFHFTPTQNIKSNGPTKSGGCSKVENAGYIAWEAFTHKWPTCIYNQMHINFL